MFHLTFFAKTLSSGFFWVLTGLFLGIDLMFHHIFKLLNEIAAYIDSIEKLEALSGFVPSQENALLIGYAIAGAEQNELKILFLGAAIVVLFLLPATLLFFLAHQNAILPSENKKDFFARPLFSKKNLKQLPQFLLKSIVFMVWASVLAGLGVVCSFILDNIFLIALTTFSTHVLFLTAAHVGAIFLGFLLFVTYAGTGFVLFLQQGTLRSFLVPTQFKSFLKARWRRFFFFTAQILLLFVMMHPLRLMFDAFIPDNSAGQYALLVIENILFALIYVVIFIWIGRSARSMTFSVPETITEKQTKKNLSKKKKSVILEKKV